MKRKLKVALVGLFVIIGLVDIILRSVYAGHVGLVHAIHDLPMSVFHVIVLPMIVFVLVSKFPVDLFGAAWKWHPKSVIALSLLIVSVAAVYSVLDAKNRFDEGLTPAEDFDKNQNARLVEIRNKQQNDLIGTQDEKINMLQKLREEYMTELKTIRKGQSDSLMNYYRQSSGREKWATFMSFVGISTFCLIFVLLILHLIMNKPMSDEAYDLILLVGVLFSSWVPFRIYAEWYNSFGKVSESSYDVLFTIIAICIIAVVAIVVLRTRSTVIKIAATVSQALTLVFSIICKYNAGLLNKFGLEMISFQLPFLLLIYMVFGIFLILIMRYIMQTLKY